MARQGDERTERDSMGEFKVPADAYYGAQTMRAVVNFPISGLRFPRSFIRALGQIKLAAELSYPASELPALVHVDFTIAHAERRG